MACAMESRGLGREELRTFYKKTSVDKSDWMFLAVSLLLYGLVVAVLVKYDLYRFSFAAIQ